LTRLRLLYYCTSTVNGTANIGLRIDAGDAVPIWTQIEDGIRSIVAKGALAPGTAVPSVRSLASELVVNPATVAKAYQRLADAGVLVVQRGEGTFVADFAAARQLKRERAALEEEALRLVRKAAVVGLSPEQIHAMVDEAMDAARVAKPAAK